MFGCLPLSQLAFGMCLVVSCSGEIGRMAEAFLLGFLATQCWLRTSFNPGRKNSKECNGKQDHLKNPNLPKSEASCSSHSREETRRSLD